MAVLSSAATTELAKLSPDLHAVFEVMFPSGVRRYVSEGAPTSSDSLGNFEGRVRSWGDIIHGAGDPNGALKPVEMSLDLVDLDGSLDGILYGSNMRSIRGSAFQIRIASANIPQAEWPVRAAGRVWDVQGAGPKAWRFMLRSNDQAFQAGRVPTDVITQPDFPNIGAVGNYGKPIPIVLGVIDSRDGTLPGQGPTGAMPVYYVNNVSGAYYGLVGLGDLFNIRRVFSNGIVLSTSAWSRVTLLMPGFLPSRITAPFQGRRMTFVKFVSDPGQATLTWDGIGLGKTFTRTAGCNPITNPVDQLRYLCNNFILPAVPWKDGPLTTSDDPLIDTPSWDAARTFMETRAYRGSLWIGNDFVDGLTLLNDFAASWGIQLTWTLSGKLALKPRDPSKTVIYGLPWWGSYEPDTNPIVPSTQQDDELGTELSAESFSLPIQSQARTTLYVGDYSQPRVSMHRVARSSSASRAATRRRWAAGFPRFLRELLDASPTGVYFADAINGLGVGGNSYNADLFDGRVSDWPDIKTFGTIRNLNSVGGETPTLKLGAIAARPSLIFDGVNSRLTNAAALSNFVSASGFHLCVAVKATANGGAALDTAPQNNPAIIADTAGAWGLAHQFTGGQNYLQAFVNDGAYKVAKVAISLNTWYLVTAALLLGTLYCSVRLFQNPASITCGNIANLTGTLVVGANGANTAKFAGELFCLIVQNDTDPTKEGLQSGFFGGGGHYYTAENVADLLRFTESQWV